MALAPGCFLWPSFRRSFPWSQLCRISENARRGCPCQICHNSAFRALWEPRFAAKCCAIFALELHSNRRRWHLRQGVFCGLLFGGVSLGRNFAEFKKLRHEGVLAKFAITRLSGHFGSRGLQQNVVLCVQFKRFLIRSWWHLRQGVFCGLLFGGVSLGGKFAEFQKMPDDGVLAKFAITRLSGHFGSHGLQQNVVLSLHLNCILIGEDGICARVFFVAFFSGEFPLVATLQNLRNCAMRVSLPNLP